MYRFKVVPHLCQGIPCLECEKFMPGLILKYRGNALISGNMADDLDIGWRLMSAIVNCPAGAIEVESL